MHFSWPKIKNDSRPPLDLSSLPQMNEHKQFFLAHNKPKRFTT